MAIPGYGSVATSVARSVPVGRDAEPVRQRPELDTHVTEAAQHHLHVVGFGVEQVELTARHRTRRDVGRGLDPIGHRLVIAGVELVGLDAGDPQPRRADALDLRAHRDEELAQVDELGFAGGVVDRRDTVGEHRRRQHVLRGADAREVEHDVGTAQTVGARLDVLVGEGERRPHRLEPGDVHVDRTGAEVVTTWHRHAHVAASGQQRAEHIDRGPHLRHQLERGDGRQITTS